MDGFGLSDETSKQRHLDDQPHLLREIMLANQALLNIFSRQVGVPASRLTLLRLLAVHHPRALGVMEIARSLGVNPAAVTRQVKDVESRGLVVRRPDPRDRRRIDLELTAEGLRVFEDVHRRAHDLEAALQADIPEGDIRTTHRVLGSIRSALERIG